MAEISAALRTLVRERAVGHCEYCHIPEVLSFTEHQIDHIIAIKHGGSSDPENLALSRTLCNRYKGSDIASVDPESGKVEPLFHPRRQMWVSTFSVEADTLLACHRLAGQPCGCCN